MRLLRLACIALNLVALLAAAPADAQITVGIEVGPAPARDIENVSVELTVKFRASNGKSRTGDTCGTVGTQPCAIYDLDEAGALLGPGDLTQYRLLSGKVAGPKCATCPLVCAAGTAGSCF